MTVESLQTMSLICYAAAGVFLLIGVVLFFTLDVPKLYSDVSGHTAKKAIEAFQRHNEYTGNIRHKTGAFSTTNGKLTDKIAMLNAGVPRTSGLPKDTLTMDGETADQVNETAVLSAENKTALLDPVSETAILSTANETTILSEIQTSADQANRSDCGQTADLWQHDPAADVFVVDVEMSFTGSAEIIE